MMFDVNMKLDINEEDFNRIKTFKRIESHLILDVFKWNKGLNIKKIPIWIMRQAGRYLPEFTELRKKFDFFELLNDPKLCAEVTLMPIKRFDLDAAIIFSDILVLSNCLGISFAMIPGFGPKCYEPLDSLQKIQNIDFNINLKQLLANTYEAIWMTRKELKHRCPLIGFTAAPWTLAAYMMSGSSENNFSEAIEFFRKEYANLKIFIEGLKFLIVQHMIYQVFFGCEIIQVFDSHLGLLSGDPILHEIMIKCNKEIAVEFKNICRSYDISIPLIIYPGKCSEFTYECLIDSLYECISIHHSKDLNVVQKQLYNKVVQGNLSPEILRDAMPNDLIQEIKRIYENCEMNRVIANLGHGIDKMTPIDNVHVFVDTVHNLEL